MRRRGTGAILLIAIFGLLGGVGYKVAENFWLMEAREIRKNPLKVLDYVPEAALRIKDFHRAKIEEGRKVWELFGEEARYLKKEQEAVIKKLRFVFYGKNGNTIEAVGDQGLIFFTDKEKEMEKMQLHGGIQVRYQGFLLHTDEVLYLKSKNQVIIPGKVTMKGDGIELEGVGMEINLLDEKIRMQQKVKTKLQPERLPSRRDGKPNGKRES